MRVISKTNKIKKIPQEKKWFEYHFDTWGFWCHIYKKIRSKKIAP
jgi:alpha-L-arabinofuranosidase